jgi:hypothetical protein
MTNTAVGLEPNPITFADFFWHRSKLMKVLCNLRCKYLNIVMKKPRKKRLLLSVDIRFLPANVDETGWLGGENTIKRLRGKRTNVVRKDLLSLKQRFEEVFMDDEKAIAEGKCRLLEEDESLEDGMALIERKKVVAGFDSFTTHRPEWLKGSSCFSLLM